MKYLIEKYFEDISSDDPELINEALISFACLLEGDILYQDLECLKQITEKLNELLNHEMKISVIYTLGKYKNSFGLNVLLSKEFSFYTGLSSEEARQFLVSIENYIHFFKKNNFTEKTTDILKLFDNQILDEESRNILFRVENSLDTHAG